MSAKRDTPKAPAVVEEFVKQLVVTYKAVLLYPPASTIPRDTAEQAVAALSDALREQAELVLTVNKTGLYYEEIPLFPDKHAYQSFALDLYNRKLSDVRFHAGAEERDIVAFLGVLKLPVEEVEASGGFESRLWEQGVGTITVTEAHVTLVDAGDLAGREADITTRPPLARNEIDELLAAAYGGRPRDQRTIARFIGDPKAVGTYLRETHAGRGELPDLMSVGERFSELAEIACETGEERYELLRSLADSLSELDPDLRRSLLVEEVLPEARTNEALASVIRQMDIDEVCRMFVEGLDGDQASREGLARAIRNLALISLADREDVVRAAGAAMMGAGLGGEFAEQVLEMASPSRLTVRERSSASSQQEKPAEAIFKLMDLAPTPENTDLSDIDPGIAALHDEARRGVTDGDVLMALVSLATIDHREQQFATTMAMLEDALELIVERGEIDVAADAAESLRRVAASDDLTYEMRRRAELAIARFTKPADIRTVAHALRLYKPGTPEHEGARRLLDILGPLAIEPLLEQLADEPDMAVRKLLIDLLSQMASQYIPELGGHVSDPRWYVVRNVVSILGSTHSSAVLPYLERTLRHPEPRVRREAIRALSGISGDRLSQEMLIAALSDDDAQNVQLAARYLGAADVRGAVPALETVARGDGRGSREAGPRVEAIEALGKLGAVEALPTLEALAGKRAIIGRAAVRELRAAAESAIARIRATQGGAQ